MIIGLVGQNCSGKDTAAEFLVSEGFVRYSLSDYLRNELQKRNMRITRENLVELGNQLRAEFGSGVLAEKALKFFQRGKNYVVVSIRNPAEAKVLMHRDDFVLVALHAPANVRFERMRKRHREGDPQTLEQFMALEAQENAGGAQQGISQTMALAKYSIDSSASMEQERLEVGKLCKKLGLIT